MEEFAFIPAILKIDFYSFSHEFMSKNLEEKFNKELEKKQEIEQKAINNAAKIHLSNIIGVMRDNDIDPNNIAEVRKRCSFTSPSPFSGKESTLLIDGNIVLSWKDEMTFEHSDGEMKATITTTFKRHY